MKKFSISITSFFIFTLFNLSITGASPHSASQVVSDVVATVKDTVSKERDKISAEQLDQKLRDIISPVFDFREMSRRSLAKHWKEANPQQQKEYVNLFSDLLAKSYLKKIRENVETSNFSIVKEQDAGAGRVVVRTQVEADGVPASIDYRMRQKENAWKVYDVIVENVGLVSNYRSEFAGIIGKEGIEGLLERLREKSAK
jgi:phospholipid transport system substrate-binding protein